MIIFIYVNYFIFGALALLLAFLFCHCTGIIYLKYIPQSLKPNIILESPAATGFFGNVLIGLFIGLCVLVGYGISHFWR